MTICKITDGVYSIGVLNPSLRVFDIIMETKYGTTYNAYLVCGSEKCALIETVHAKYFDEYIENISALTDISKIDYLILNHTEPDHTGSVERLLQINPNITVIATAAGIKYVGSISNSDLKTHTVKQDDTLELGEKTLKFIPVPFLHWPDSMFTYIEEDKVLFSCDMFGAHYCEPRTFDSLIADKEAYDDALSYYYTAIFSPFKPHVLAGIEKTDGLEKDFICTSHGPVLTKATMENVIEKYKLWSAPVQKEKKSAAILYVSAYGYTRMLAQKAYGVAAELGFETQRRDIIKHDAAEISWLANESDILMFGSPTINRDAPKPVWDTISSIDAVNCAKKSALVFGSYGWSGEAVNALKSRLEELRFNVFKDGFKVNFKPSKQGMCEFEEYVREFLAQT